MALISPVALMLENVKKLREWIKGQKRRYDPTVTQIHLNL
jgi:hypothetical protein